MGRPKKANQPKAQKVQNVSSASNDPIATTDVDENDALPSLNQVLSSQQQNQQLSLQLQQQQQINIQLQQQLQQQIQPSTPSEIKKTAVKPRAKKTKTDEEMIEVCAIVYDCSSKHPNFNLNECIDRYPIDEICGFGDDVFRDQVKSIKIILS
jgi:exonuclease VII large subunit